MVIIVKHYIIPLFIPHYGCPHQCIFCNQREITGQQKPVSADDVAVTINQHLKNINEPRFIEVAFYGGSFTALPLAMQRSLLEPAYKFKMKGAIHSIRLSTRPDCITNEIIQFISDYGVDIVELGVQSMDEEVLSLSGRGHTAYDVKKAVTLIQAAKLILGIQVMIGLPGDTWLSTIHTARSVAKIKPDLARIYPALVIKGTELANLFCSGKYVPLTIEEAVARSAFLKTVFQGNGINVIRTGLQATEELSDKNVVLAGPYHPAFGEMVDSYILFVKISRVLEDIAVLNAKTGIVKLHYHKRDESKLIGLRRANISKWQQNYPAINIKLCSDSMPGKVYIEYRNIFFDLSKNYPWIIYEKEGINNQHGE